MINKKIYRLNEDTIDSLVRFLKSNNIVSYVACFFLNIFWFMGKTITKLLKKDKTEVVVEQDNRYLEIESSFSLRSLYQLLDIYKNNRKCALYIDLLKEVGDISGALDYSIKKKEELCSNGYTIINLQYCRQSNNWFIVVDEINKIKLDNFDDVKKLFLFFSIKLLFINNLVYCTKPNEVINTIVFLKTNYNFNLEYAFHDYLSICPSYFLINKQGMPCEIIDDEKCNECLLNNPYRSLIINDIGKWREQFSKLFNSCDKLYVFSEYTKSIINRVFVGLDSKLEIVPHKPLFNSNSSKYIRPARGEQLTIGFVGNFHHVKGADFYIELINKLKNNGYNVKPIVIGYKKDDEYNDLDFAFTGQYDRDNLGKILSDNKVDFVVYPSINSETYSYIVQELMLLEVPLIVFRRGAPAERIDKQNYKLAEIANYISIDSLYEATVKLINKL